MSDTPENSRGFLLADILICLCFFLSGLAALVYQTVWARLFSISFGTSELAIATVLAAYMGGLALGSALISRRADSIKRPVFLYAVLEGAIGLSALAVPFLIGLAGMLYAALLGGQDLPPPSASAGQLTFYVLATFAIILVPTACMGATLPVLNRYLVRHDSQIGSRTGLLYGLNTVGAVAGVLLATFLLLPNLGLMAVQWIAVSVNLLIFLLAWVLFNQLNADRLSAATEEVRPSLAGKSVPWLGIVPLVMFASGAISFLYEVLWTRLLGQLLGSSIYSFGIMLAAFLTGIALGGGLAGRLAVDQATARRRLAYTQVLIAFLAMGCYLFVGAWPIAGFDLVQKFWITGAVMLPATLLIGATFPLAVRAVARGEQEIGQVSARIYSVNTVGAIVGAVGTGFLLLPTLGFSGTAQLAMVANLLLAALLLASNQPAFKSAAAIPLLLLAIAAGVWNLDRPASQVEQVPPGFAGIGNAEEISFEVGRNSSVLLLEQPEFVQIRTNGLPEAAAPVVGSWDYGSDQAWWSILPLWLRPQSESIMVIGLGGGVMLQPVPQDFPRIDVVELEHEVVEANRLMGPMRRIDPLQHPNLNLVVNDARNALRLTQSRYDIVISQPSHPWTAGASHLFTREFVQLVKSRMSDDGVFVQWMNLEFIDESLLRDMAATLTGEFAQVQLYSAFPGTLMFAASDAPLDAASQSLEQQVFSWFRPHGIYSIAQLRAALHVDSDAMHELAAGGRPVTDNYNRMMLDSYSDSSGLTLQEFWALVESYDALSAPGSSYPQLPLQARLQLVRALNAGGQYVRARSFVESTPDTIDDFFWLGLIAMEEKQYETAQQRFQQILEVLPDNTEVQFFLAWSQLQGGTGMAGNLSFDRQGVTDPSLLSTLTAWTAGYNSRWDEVAPQLEIVTQTHPRSAWYPLALEVAAWAELLQPNVTPEGYLRALSLLDESLRLTRGTAQRLELRANLSEQLGLVDHLLFSSLRLMAFFNSYLQLNGLGEPQQVGSIRQALDEFEVKLAPLSLQDAFRVRRLERVEQHIDGLRDLIATEAGQAP